MADPATLAVISIGTTVAGGIMGGIGASQAAEGRAQGAEAQGRVYQYQAAVAKLNQQISKQNASWEREAGEVEAQESGMQTRGKIGGTKVAQAASGLDVNVGSPADVRESEQEIGTYDQELIRNNAARRAYGSEVQGMQHEAQAAVDVMGGAESGRAAGRYRDAGTIGAVSSILGSASTVSSRWMQYRGTFGAAGTGTV